MRMRRGEANKKNGDVRKDWWMKEDSEEGEDNEEEK